MLGDRSLDIPNSRLRNLKEKTLRYRFHMHHLPGVKHKATDAISRRPVGSINPELLSLPDDIAATYEATSMPPITTVKYYLLTGIRCVEPTQCTLNDNNLSIYAATSLAALQSVTWEKVQLATNIDKDMIHLLAIIESGFPDSRHELPPKLQSYHQFRDNLHSLDGVIIYKDRIVIPPCLREDILATLHSAHQGVTSMIARAETSVFWPGITPAITALCNNCNDCNRMAPSQPSAPPTSTVPPAYPFQCICADYFQHKGKHYLVSVDRYSNWPIIERVADGATGIINSLRCTFVT